MTKHYYGGVWFDDSEKVVRYCQTCRRKTEQRNPHDTLDAAHYICTVCGGEEYVPEMAPYDSSPARKPD
jgi:hypothetical protein